ncbi:MAG: tetratricopeptide repeat protein [Muribaculaceae bacterium]|nr:tetratricopeptide repeat protein [Muribaculaceae bacterium]
MKRYLVILTIVLMAVTVMAGKKEMTDKKTVSLADQRKAEYIFMEAQKQKLADNYDAFYELMAHAHEIDPGNTAISFYMGMCMLRMNNTTKERCEEGLALMKEHFEAQPEDLYETTFYSDANMQLGHPEEGLRAIKLLNEVNPNRLELLVRLAEAYSHSGDFDQSNATYDSIATMFGSSIQLTSSKIENYMSMNDSTGALREMRGLLYTAPRNDSYNLAMSGLFQHYGMIDSALYYLDRAQEYAPDNGVIYLTRAEYCIEAGDSAGYEQQIYNALTAEQLDVDTKLSVMLSYIREKLAEEDTTQRINNLFTILIQQHPHEAKIHQLYSEYLYAKKDIKGAIEQLGYSLDVNPTDASGWRNMVILNMLDDNYAEAIKASEKALEYNPDNLDLYGYVAGSYNQMKQYDKAIATYEKILTMADSTDVERIANVITGMGDSYSEMKDSVKTVECYQRALELDPANSGALNNYAYFLAQRAQDLDNAERMAALALKYEPDNANFIDTYAWVYFAKKDYTNALLYIKNAVEHDKDNHLLEHYGDILWFNDEKEQAVEQWTKALEADPDNELLQRKVKDKTYYEK